MNITENLILEPYFILNNGTKIDMTKELQPYGYRSIWEIVASCVLTIFACTWATIHPNIPSKFRYKAHLWIVDLILPELVLLWAAKQCFAAWSLMKKKARHDVENSVAGEAETIETTMPSSSTSCDEGGESSDRTMGQSLFVFLRGFFARGDKGRKNTSDWSTTQAFFALMGGSQDEEGHILSPYTSRDRIKMPTDEEILDKSKADSFVKLLALVQTVWFALTTIYRIQSPYLYATEAEIITFTFACLSAITKFFWWNKPTGVNLPLPYYPNPTPSGDPQASTIDATPPNCFKLATSILGPDSSTTHNEFIPKSDIYAYYGVLSWGEMTIAVLCASFFGSLSGVCYLTTASLGDGLTSTHGRIWFSFAFLGSALPFYLLLVVPISFILQVRGGTEMGKAFLHHALSSPFGPIFLITSVIGRIALTVALVCFMFFPFGYSAFLTPEWAQYIPHPC